MENVFFPLEAAQYLTFSPNSIMKNDKHLCDAAYNLKGTNSINYYATQYFISF